MTTGERLREWRGELSQKAAALSCGIKQPVWFRYEQDVTEPAADSIRKICNFFGRSADELLGLPARGGSATVTNSPGAAVANGSHARASVGPDCEKCPFKQLAIDFQQRMLKLRERKP